MFTSAASQVSICNQALARCGVKQFITSLSPAADSSQEAVVCALFWDAVRQKLLAGFPWKFATRTAVLQEFPAQVSSVEQLGTGDATVTPAITTDPVGTYNVVLRVTTAGGTGVGQYQVSIDGGVTYAAAVTMSTSVPYALALTTGALTLTWAAVSVLVKNDVYRFTVTDGVSPEYSYCYALPADLLTGRYLWPGSRSVRSDQRVPWKRGSLGNLDVLWSDASPDQSPTIIYVEDVTDATRFPAGFTDALAWRLAYEISGPLMAKAAPQDLERAYMLAVNEARSVDFIEFQEDRPPDSETVAARGYNWSPYGVGGIPPPGGWFPY